MMVHGKKKKAVVVLLLLLLFIILESFCYSINMYIAKQKATIKDLIHVSCLMMSHHRDHRTDLLILLL